MSDCLLFPFLGYHGFADQQVDEEDAVFKREAHDDHMRHISKKIERVRTTLGTSARKLRG
jgi:hypothetical protein